jgi:hypothetical protein
LGDSRGITGLKMTSQLASGLCLKLNLIYEERPRDWKLLKRNINFSCLM